MLFQTDKLNSSCTHKEVARRTSCSFDWIQLWHTAARLITNSVTCRAACYLLHSILANGLVSYQEIAEDIDAIVTTTEISAPATLSDSSISLMIHLLSARNMEVPGGSSSAAHHVIRWISSKWDPGMTSLTTNGNCEYIAYLIKLKSHSRHGARLMCIPSIF
jgi:serine-protein kinase ATM